MLIVMTVQTQQFPVAAVRGIVVVVVVAMMNRQLLQIDPRKFTRTTATYPRINLQSALAIAFVTLLCAFIGFGNDAVQSCSIWLFTRQNVC